MSGRNSLPQTVCPLWIKVGGEDMVRAHGNHLQGLALWIFRDRVDFVVSPCIVTLGLHLVFWKFQASTSNTLCCHPAQISRDSALCVAASTFASVSRCHSPLQVAVKLRWKRRCWQVREQLQQWFVAQNKLFERCLVGCLAPQGTPDGHPWRVHALTRTQ